MQADSRDAVEERTRHWLEASYLSAIAAYHSAQTAFDADGRPRQLTRYHFQEVLRKLKIFRWLDRLRFESFIDVGSGFDEYPNFVRDRYNASAYFADFAHSMNLPYGGSEHGRLDHAVTLNIVRLPFADETFDVVLSSEVLEHLVRPVEAISELLRVARKCVIMTSLEALSVSRWQRLLSHLRVDVRQPHVERNFFLLPELEAIFGPDWHHENLFYDGNLPASSFDPGERQESAYGAIRDVDTFATALCRAVSVDDHRSGAMGILIVKTKPGVAVGSPTDQHELARWLIHRTAKGQHAGSRLVEQIRSGTAPFTNPDRPIAENLRSLLRCPDCRGKLEPLGPGLRCPTCNSAFDGEYGVPKLYPKKLPPDYRLDSAALSRLCGGDPQRESIVRSVRERLRSNEDPPGAVRQLWWKVDRLLG